MMACLMLSKNFNRWSKEAGPAFLILILTIIVSIFLGEFTFLRGFEAIYKGLFRFFRITLLLYLPLYLLLPVFGRLGKVAQRKNSTFLQMEKKQDLEIHPVKHWLSRPFQGIGVGILFGTKLLSVLQVMTGATATASLFIPTGRFQFGRFLIVAGITIFVSMLLSTIWTLDDMGIRIFNRKNQEIKMIGKYAGTLMPILFGFYGVFSLFSQFQKKEALIYLFQMIVILYPSFTIFSVFHTHFLRRNIESLSKKLFSEKRETYIIHVMTK